MSGKGSRPRPLSVPRKVYEDNYDRIFKHGKRKAKGKKNDRRKR